MTITKGLADLPQDALSFCTSLNWFTFPYSVQQSGACKCTDVQLWYFRSRFRYVPGHPVHSVPLVAGTTLIISCLICGARKYGSFPMNLLQACRTGRHTQLTTETICIHCQKVIIVLFRITCFIVGSHVMFIVPTYSRDNIILLLSFHGID